ncbi:mitochondrial flavine adenine dinucleotide (FAD) carrier protein, putative [Candida dubliniensis CD36]|uniref:Mitochondrial thiamine pyrophosphate carrier 1 n=1 Tax=Candida dubliniensis (strain CD36 / ATCC MYA-646 / CBS 7987 / NCPF 3949 / NRRL Y-17841) TaxID=573826 RepID=B9WK71_CANDC|nr:mitochondrial flavine adenine dinucleotide (FAD) carrier protein, putative [Candida dubliniensis CD36]CAX40723.1 mitochondrial flavine adenine dinucleotide (FAD) carrier protein, putative [Candida dubliniensis CD36]
MGLNTTRQQFCAPRFSPREIEVISGLLAGFSTTIVTHPLDVIKIRLQLSRDTPKTSHPLESVISVINRINQDAKVTYKSNHKPKAFNYLIQYYRGITPNLIGNISAWGIYFALYAEFKSKVDTSNTTLNYFTSSVLAGLSTSIITNPLWVLKTRILGSSRNESNAYRSVTDGVKQMLAKEGITSFWKGTIPSLFSVVQASLQITIYDHIKVYLSSGNHRSDSIGTTSHLTTWQYLYSSASSKIISMLILYPTQVVRSRLQYSQDSSLDIISVIKELYYKEGGLKGFYKGIGANILRVLPATCVTFVAYENVKRYLS